MDRIADEEELEEALSRPTKADAAFASSLEGDVIVLGAGGKMGPSLCRLVRRAGIRGTVTAVSRFSQPAVRDGLESAGIRTVSCDLLDRSSVERLPESRNVLFLAGQKFGTGGNEPVTWAENTWLPALVAERFRDSRIVAFSTGNVYPLLRVSEGGATEAHPTGPVGEYAQSALGRERIFQYFSSRSGTPVLLFRLNYAVELRYGILRDVGEKVLRREPIDLTMGYVNVIWQRDANSAAFRSLGLCESPAKVLNMTGAEILAIRRIAERFAERFGVEPAFRGREAETALLSDASHGHALLGPSETTTEQMVAWTAEWIRSGGKSLGKPTHFDQREGSF